MQDNDGLQTNLQQSSNLKLIKNAPVGRQSSSYETWISSAEGWTAIMSENINALKQLL